MVHLTRSRHHPLTWCGLVIPESLLDDEHRELQMMPRDDRAVRLAALAVGDAPNVCDACAEAALRFHAGEWERLRKLAGRMGPDRRRGKW